MFGWFSKKPVKPPSPGAAVRMIMIQLDVDEQPSLFLLLGEDGTFNRSGAGGGAVNKDGPLVIAKIDPQAFLALRDTITEELMKWFGGALALKDRKGPTCQLKIVFADEQQNELASKWTYGAESNSPPPEIMKFVADAVELTNPWFERAKAAEK